MNEIEWSKSRFKRGANAVRIYGLWMSLQDLDNNIKDFGDDEELNKLCERCKRCYLAGKKV